MQIYLKIYHFLYTKKGMTLFLNGGKINFTKYFIVKLIKFNKTN
jgi:hypothetical protein